MTSNAVTRLLDLATVSIFLVILLTVDPTMAAVVLALGILQGLVGQLARRLGIHALGLVDQRQLISLQLGHVRDFVALHGDLVLVNLPLAFRGEIPAGSHRQRVGDRAGDTGDDDGFVLLRGRGA